MDVYEALKQMRALSKENIPFEIVYTSLNTTDSTSKGLKKVKSCLLRKGLPKDKSKKARVLVQYTDLADNKPKSFYLPLLWEFNKITLD